MSSNVLYFPTIAFPRGAWANRALLYWDTIGSIIPERYLKDENEKIDPYTEELLNADLLVAVYPESRLRRPGRFGEAFKSYIDGLSPSQLSSRQRAFRAESKDNLSGIYYSKLAHVDRFLCDKQLAFRDGRWIYVEQRTAKEFMTFLAITLSKSQEERFVPITDRLQYLRVINRLDRGQGRHPHMRGFGERVTKVCENLVALALPAPSIQLVALDIVRFKERNRDQLTRFRLYIEQTAIQIAGASSYSQRQLILENARDYILFEREQIVARIRENGWDSNLGNFAFVVLKQLPVIGIFFQLIEQFVVNDPAPNLDHPIAYAASLEHEFGSLGT